MNIFSDVNIEFFDLKDQPPNHDEQVVIILKAGVDSGNPTPWIYKTPRAPVIFTTAVTMDFAKYQTYKTRESVFRCKTTSRCRTFKASDIICWGRLQ